MMRRQRVEFNRIFVQGEASARLAVGGTPTVVVVGARTAILVAVPATAKHGAGRGGDG